MGSIWASFAELKIQLWRFNIAIFFGSVREEAMVMVIAMVAPPKGARIS